MDKLVIDSSVAIKWVLPETHSQEARRILDDYQLGKVELLAPDLLFAEIGNILWKKHVFAALPLVDIEALAQSLQAVSFSVTPISVLWRTALQIAMTQNRTVYDCLYLALSTREKCRFVTADEKFVNAVQAAYPDTIWIGKWP